MPGVETIFPPAVQCQDEGITIVDDMTSVFRPALAAGAPQTQIFGGPRIKMTRRVFVRQSELGLTFSFFQETRGKGYRFYTSPTYKNRGAFPNAELLANQDFAAGTNNWTCGALFSLALTDKIMRAKRSGAGAEYALKQSAPYTQYAPHALRAVAQSSNPLATLYGYSTGYSQAPGSNYGAFSKANNGYIVIASVPVTASATNDSGIVETGTGMLAGDYVDIPWVSFSRCALADAGGNGLTYSDDINNAAWTKSSCSINNSAHAAPDGTQNGDGIVETAVTANHYIQQTNIAVGAAQQDLTFGAFVQYSSRQWCWMRLYENTGNSYISAYFNLNGAGSVGTTSTGANWANLRTSIQGYGNGWYYCTITGSKTNAATGLAAELHCATANGTSNYLGNGSEAISAWRLSVMNSAVPMKAIQTTASAVGANLSTFAGSLPLKGLPASTTGLLLKGDLLEVNGELKIVTAALDSDASGLGTVFFGPDLTATPPDNAPVIFRLPMGKFIQSADPQITNRFGQYAEVTLEMEQVY
jgi:hypothetical protein